MVVHISRKTKKYIIFVLLFAGIDNTLLCILHINEPFYHTKTDYLSSEFITDTSVKAA